MYEKDLFELREENRECLYSIQDVSTNLGETDLYIEKYLPVRTQEMINRAFKYFSETDSEKEKVLDFEVKMYKELHNKIINEPEPSLDKGKPTMPSLIELEKSLKEMKKRNTILKAYEDNKLKNLKSGYS